MLKKGWFFYMFYCIPNYRTVDYQYLFIVFIFHNYRDNVGIMGTKR